MRHKNFNIFNFFFVCPLIYKFLLSCAFFCSLPFDRSIYLSFLCMNAFNRTHSLTRVTNFTLAVRQVGRCVPLSLLTRIKLNAITLTAIWFFSSLKYLPLHVQSSTECRDMREAWRKRGSSRERRRTVGSIVQVQLFSHREQSSCICTCLAGLCIGLKSRVKCAGYHRRNARWHRLLQE